MNVKSNNLFKNTFYLLFLVFFSFGTLTFKDYGITTDEEFQRFSGFYWLNYILQYTPFETLKFEVLDRLNKIDGFTLPNPINHPYYGIIFDTPLAFLETILNIENKKNYFYLRHFFNFLIFFFSSIFFYKILKNRFQENFIILIGVLFYIGTPRILGDSFYNNKDVVFLSFVTIAIYYCFKSYDKFNYRNLFFLSFFSALTTASRIHGVFIPITFIFFYFISNFNNKIEFNNLLKIFFFLSFYLIATFCLYPYFWEAPIKNFLTAVRLFSNFSSVLDIQLLFNGEYVKNNFLPSFYIPLWILITTPLITIFFFLLGYFFLIKRFLFRLISIKENSPYNDFWRGKNEKKDIYILSIFTFIIFYAVLNNMTFYSGWRQVYFLNIFLIYIAIVGVNFIHLNISLRLRKIFYAIVLLSISFIYLKIIILHPYQGLYFNNLVTDKKKDAFEIDYWGLAGVKSLNYILSLEKNNSEIKIARATFVPLERSLSLLSEENAKKIKIVGQNYQDANYIFSSNISEVNKKTNFKYKIPENFKKIHQFKLDGFLIYELFKKK